MLYISIAILGGVIILILIALLKKNKPEIDYEKISQLVKSEIARLELVIKDENRNIRMEINNTLSNIKNEITQNLKDNRIELNENIRLFRQTNEQKLSEFAFTLKQTTDEIIIKHEDIKNSTEVKLEAVRKTVEDKLLLLQTENSKKLDEMRNTVDQKLQETLDKKLSESFNNVSKQLQDVYKGLGEMKSLANDVGGLKKVLTNVKTRGLIGEIQLGSILDAILSPEQYENNVATKSNTQERVEYAIKLPGKDELNSIVYLPIDSKFPDSSYQNLLTAYEEADPVKITLARKELEKAIKTSAKDIRDKYLNPPDTTDFAILFLPFEGLYAEVLQNTNLVHQIQSEYHINITGPTTLGAFINSLQMGFKTLAIEKRSSEVWRLLGSVKLEFDRFGDVLSKAQTKLRGASDEIEKLVGARTRKIQTALKSVEKMPEYQNINLLDSEEEETTE